MRRLTICVAAALLAFSTQLAAQIPGQSEQARRIGKKLMCMCGCNQVLGECNHVGCSVSTSMLRQVDERVASGQSDDLILQSFVQEYGQKVLAQPPSSGFGLAGWVMPFAALLAGLILIPMILRRWRRPAAAAPAAEVSSALLERARQETDLDADLDGLRGAAEKR